jgi:hypothetical protein
MIREKGGFGKKKIALHAENEIDEPLDPKQVETV